MEEMKTTKRPYEEVAGDNRKQNLRREVDRVTRTIAELAFTTKSSSKTRGSKDKL